MEEGDREEGQQPRSLSPGLRLFTTLLLSDVFIFKSQKT